MPVGGVVGKRQLFRPDGPLVSEIGFGAWYVRATRRSRADRQADCQALTTLTLVTGHCLCGACCRPIGGAFGEVERRTGLDTVQAAVRVGASFIDTADCASRSPGFLPACRASLHNTCTTTCRLPALTAASPA
eukprot:COSAG06_NODE_4505_length_4195_cov_72.292969_3_plen_133_part_00